MTRGEKKIRRQALDLLQSVEAAVRRVEAKQAVAQMKGHTFQYRILTRKLSRMYPALEVSRARYAALMADLRGGEHDRHS